MQPVMGVDTFLLHGKVQDYEWEGVGSLSLKSFYSGQALYRVETGAHLVDDRCYLLLNHQQHYDLTIAAEPPLESFCIFFAPGFAEDVARSLTDPDVRLLDELYGPAAPVHFFERTYPHDALVSPLLFRLREAARKQPLEPVWLHEQLHGLMESLLQVHQQTWREAEQLPASKRSTREELYRRLARARDYAAALFASPLTLAELAQVACLSPNHFLRTFQAAFHQTPHQYLTASRLEAAQRLLRHTDRSVTEICFDVGFVSLGSFSSLFRQKVGLSPEAYRRQKR
jgi:AraC-like DNA-binding protein